MVRTDFGTENSLLALIQPILRHNHTDAAAGGKSFVYGKSIHNQVYFCIIATMYVIVCV